MLSVLNQCDLHFRPLQDSHTYGRDLPLRLLLSTYDYTLLCFLMLSSEAKPPFLFSFGFGLVPTPGTFITGIILSLIMVVGVDLTCFLC